MDIFKALRLDYSDQFYNMQACGYAVVNIYQDKKNKDIKKI